VYRYQEVTIRKSLYRKISHWYKVFGFF